MNRRTITIILCFTGTISLALSALFLVLAYNFIASAFYQGFVLHFKRNPFEIAMTLVFLTQGLYFLMHSFGLFMKKKIGRLLTLFLPISFCLTYLTGSWSIIALLTIVIYCGLLIFFITRQTVSAVFIEETRLKEASEAKTI
jgi:hypothetical protein